MRSATRSEAVPRRRVSSVGSARSSSSTDSSTDAAVRFKGTMYLAPHPHGKHAWGAWVGMSYDGAVISGWAPWRDPNEQVRQIVQDLIDTKGAPHGPDR